MKRFETPILFLVFNRPELTKVVLARIKEIQPKYLFVAADGPRADHLDDEKKCKEVRNIIAEEVDWPCELKSLYRKENVGCKLAVSQAINWFFGDVEEGIILEDDTVPDYSFFQYCDDLLNYYRNDEEVMMISGFNHFTKSLNKKKSFLFAFYGGVWGWATWRRAWNKYDVNMTAWRDSSAQNIISENLKIPKTLLRTDFKLLEDCYAGKIDTWDYQWRFSRFYNNGLTIIPGKNLVRNIGFGEDATHTKDLESDLRMVPSYTFKRKLIKKRIDHERNYDLKYLRTFLNRSNKDISMKFRFKRFLSKGFNSSPADYVELLKKKVMGGNRRRLEDINKPVAEWKTVKSGYGKGIKLFIDTFSPLSNWSEMITGNYDEYLFREAFENGVDLEHIWDVGAHFGFNSMIFANQIKDTGKVIAFEPNPFNRERFEVNLKQNQNLKERIQILPYALSESNAKALFTMSDDVDSSISTGSHISTIQAPREKVLYEQLNFTQVEVECRTADSLIEDDLIPIPDLIKIDIEGAEFNFLKGARVLINNYRPILLIEIHNVLAMYDVLNYLNNFSYNVDLLDRENATLSRCFIIALP